MDRKLMEEQNKKTAIEVRKEEIIEEYYMKLSNIYSKFLYGGIIVLFLDIFLLFFAITIESTNQELAGIINFEGMIFIMGLGYLISPIFIFNGIFSRMGSFFVQKKLHWIISPILGLITMNLFFFGFSSPSQVSWIIDVFNFTNILYILYIIVSVFVILLWWAGLETILKTWSRKNVERNIAGPIIEREFNL